jgi:hypothetical protein
MDLEKIVTEFNQSITKFSGNLEEKETAQRSEDWFKKRLGKFTGSRIKDLMTCKSKAKGKSWNEKKWLCDFGDTALTYVIERAIERATQTRIETPTTWQMTYGTNMEPNGIEAIAKHLNTQVNEVDFNLFLKNAGASADGLVSLKTTIDVNQSQNVLINNDVQVNLISGIIPIELKCPATPMSHYKLMNNEVVEGHDYFWQCQSEMMATKSNILLFFTYDQRFPESSQLGMHVVNLSKPHEFAVKFRCLIGEMLIKKLIDCNFRAEIRFLLMQICREIPDDFDQLNEWFNENIKELEL